MSYIKTRANKLSQELITRGSIEHQEVISRTQTELYNIDNVSDKVILITTILEHNQTEYQQHLEDCTNKTNCTVNYEHESVTYFLTQELNRLGVRTNNDQFTIEEKNLLVSTLDALKEDLQTIKDGQQIIYDEIESLKEQFILGKKTWSQLFIGKFTEMTISGIISDTVSKEIISTIKNIDFTELIKIN